VNLGAPFLNGPFVFTVTLAFFHNYGRSSKNAANKGPCRTINEICKRHRNSQLTLINSERAADREWWRKFRLYGGERQEFIGERRAE
jgi:hypothetical protein